MNETLKIINTLISMSNPQSFNSSMFWFNVNNQELVMFPSYLRHSVPRNETKQTSVSISFNTWVKGTLGSELNLTELIME